MKNMHRQEEFPWIIAAKSGQEFIITSSCIQIWIMLDMKLLFSSYNLRKAEISSFKKKKIHESVCFRGGFCRAAGHSFMWSKKKIIWLKIAANLFTTNMYFRPLLVPRTALPYYPQSFLCPYHPVGFCHPLCFYQSCFHVSDERWSLLITSTFFLSVATAIEYLESNCFVWPNVFLLNSYSNSTEWVLRFFSAFCRLELFRVAWLWPAEDSICTEKTV